MTFGVHHVQLAIEPGSEDRCRAFYVGVLGLTEIPKPPELAARGGLWVQAGGVRDGGVRDGGLELHLGVETDFRPARKAHPGILADDLDAVASRLEAHGSPVEWDDGFPGHRRFYTRDCLGNRLEFLTPVPPAT